MPHLPATALAGAGLLAVSADDSTLPTGLLVLVGALFGVFAVYSLVRRALRVAFVLGVVAVVLVLSDIGRLELL